jgi:hypothetical protein
MADDRNFLQRLRSLTDRIRTVATGRGEQDLTALLIHRAERAVIEGPAGPTVPNRYDLTAGEPREEHDRVALERHYEEVLTGTAVHRGWRFDGPMRVGLSPGGRSPRVETFFEQGELSAWAVLTSSADDEPVAVRHNRAVVGRSREADVVIDASGISRRHALLWREAGRVWIADYQSANGTFVNGNPVYEVVEVRRADVILFGDADYTFGMA